MENKFKEVNEAILGYAVSATTQVVELNQKLWNDYVALTQNLVNMVPGLNSILDTFKK